MMYVSIGIIGFLLFFIYDINDIKWRKKQLNTMFTLGCILILVSTAGVVSSSWQYHQQNWWFIVPALLFLLLLVYTLFFALPFSDTYVSSERGRPVCKTGVYALCRHPGVLWFIGLYGFLYLTFPSDQFAIYAVAICICNVIYIVFQDFWTFPKTFDDYDTYKKQAPFLIPCLSSIQNCFKTMGKRG
ncbi:hypothetical protein [Hydrogenoanaerobacterium sp.]|uniref:hypothetical protein n=1 Tax=Hydrogenoanaerobacterium sp. TaxID=2953763 RepID=UPI002898DEC7|nr:hypothetical protein [Hydrogenoanaerobacterium sp.]